MTKYLFMASLFFCIASSCQTQQENKSHIDEKNIAKNGMIVNWYYQNDRIYFEMSAPTDGWVTIGFNTDAGMAGAYLLMGNIINETANVVEYYTTSPGHYKPIREHGAAAQVQHIEGVEEGKNTTLKFSLPIKSLSKYQKGLSKDMEYVMIMAFSGADDFQHHSMMRTAVKIKL